MYILSENDLITINKEICSVFHSNYNVLNFDALSACLNAYYSYYKDDNRISSAIFRSIITNHAFKDANKRTAFLTLQFINPSRIGLRKIANLALDIAKDTSMEVNDICNILYPKLTNEALDFKHVYSYQGPVFKNGHFFTEIKDPLYVTAKTKNQAATFLQGRLKSTSGFEYFVKLTIDKNKLKETEDSSINKYQLSNNKYKNNKDTDYKNLVGSFNNTDIFFINGKYIVDNMEFESMNEVYDYLEEY